MNTARDDIRKALCDEEYENDSNAYLTIIFLRKIMNVHVREMYHSMEAYCKLDHMCHTLYPLLTNDEHGQQCDVDNKPIDENAKCRKCGERGKA